MQEKYSSNNVKLKNAGGFEQFGVLTLKNWWVIKRRPIIFLILLFSLSLALLLVPLASHFLSSFYQEIPPSYSLEPCYKYSEVRPCFLAAYSPNSAEIDDIMKRAAVTLGYDPATSILGYDTDTDMLESIFNNLGSVIIGVGFQDIPESLSKKTFAYTLFYNYSDTEYIEYYSGFFPSYLIDIQNAIDSAIIQARFPTEHIHPPFSVKKSIEILDKDEWMFRNQNEGIDKYYTSFCVYIGTFVFSAIIFFLVIEEKRNNVISYLRVFSLKKWAYWASFYVPLMIFAIISSLIATLVGYLLGLKLFVNAVFFLNFLALLGFLFAFSAFMMFLSVFIKRIAGMFVVLCVGVILMFTMEAAPLFQNIIITKPFIAFIWTFFSPHILYGRLAFSFQECGSGPDKIFHFSDLSSTACLAPNNSDHYISNGSTLIMLYLSAIVYFFLTLFLSQFFSNIFGAKTTFSSLFKDKSAQKKTEPNQVFVEKDQSDNVPSDVGEDYLTSLQRKSNEGMIVTQKLSKSYKNKQALREVSIEMKTNQVFCLLGENGAGKTTLIKILTGFESLTFGEAWIFGNSLRTHHNDVFSLIGLCNQDNIHYGYLTILEHLRLYGRLRGLSEKESLESASSLLKQFQLADRSNSLLGTLSGGMQRRVAVMSAFIASPRVVFLDEPTTGLDPVSRLATWRAIKQLRRNRIIVLTTHSMEEAEKIGDKICILQNGQIRAMGTSSYLKKRFGKGYVLNVQCSPENDPILRKLLRLNLGFDLEMQDNIGTFSINIPHELLGKLTSFLKRILEKKCLKEWGLQNSTLEEVFLALSEEKGINSLSHIPQHEQLCINCLCRDRSPNSLLVVPTPSKHFLSLEGLLCGECNSILSVKESNDLSLVSNVGDDPHIIDSNHGAVEEENLLRQLLSLHDSNIIKRRKEENDEMANKNAAPHKRIRKFTISIPKQILALNQMSFYRTLSNKKFFISGCVILGFCFLILMSAGMSLKNDGTYECGNYRAYTCNSSVMANEEIRFGHRYFFPCSPSDYNNTYHFNNTCHIPPEYNGYSELLRFDSYSKISIMTKNAPDEVINQYPSFLDSFFFIDYLGDENIPIRDGLLQSLRCSPLKQPIENSAFEWCPYLYTCDDDVNPEYLKTHVPNIAIDFSEYLTSNEVSFFLNRACFVFSSDEVTNETEVFTFDNNFTFLDFHLYYMNMGLLEHLETSYNVTQRTSIEKSFQAFPHFYFRSDSTQESISKLMAFFITLFFCFFLPSLVYMLSMDKHGGKYSLMKLHGMKFWSYIMGYMIYVSILMLAIYFVFALMVLSLDLISTTHVLLILIALPAWAFATSTLSIVIAHIQNHPSTTVIILVILLPLFSSMPLIFNSAMNPLWYIDLIYILIPPFSLGSYFNHVFHSTSFPLLNFFYLFLSGAIYFLICLLIFFNKFELRRIFKQFLFFKKLRDIPKNELALMEAGGFYNALEARDIEKEFPLGDGSQSLIWKLISPFKACLSKTIKSRQYKIRKVLKGIHETLKPGECFGLLGSNGSGKTTLVKILSGQLVQNKGQVYINGENTQKMNHCHFGISPQFDVLWEDLTIEQHLSFFSLLQVFFLCVRNSGDIHSISKKGIPTSEIKEWCYGLSKRAQLDGDCYRMKVKTLSGGLKRKTSLVNALAGNKPLILLDEPTTGIDPVSRRQIWNLIQGEIGNGKAFIITSHSMEEVDVLCHRISILRAGQFVVSGTPFEIKQSFGGGNILKGTLFTPWQDEKSDEFIKLKEFLLDSGCTNINLHQLEENSFTISLGSTVPVELLKLLESNAPKFGIQDWEINNGSLDRAFVHIMGEDEEIEKPTY